MIIITAWAPKATIFQYFFVVVCASLLYTRWQNYVIYLHSNFILHYIYALYIKRIHIIWFSIDVSPLSQAICWLFSCLCLEKKKIIYNAYYIFGRKIISTPTIHKQYTYYIYIYAKAIKSVFMNGFYYNSLS